MSSVAQTLLQPFGNGVLNGGGAFVAHGGENVAKEEVGTDVVGFHGGAAVEVGTGEVEAAHGEMDFAARVERLEMGGQHVEGLVDGLECALQTALRKEDAGFSDVPAKEYYAQAVNWAAEQKIVSGYPGGTFQPGKTISREEICALLYNYAKWAKLDLPDGGTLTFKDGDKISPWAKPAVDACTGAKLVNGESNPDGSLTMSPQKTMSRAHAAVLLARFHEKYY